MFSDFNRPEPTPEELRFIWGHWRDVYKRLLNCLYLNEDDFDDIMARIDLIRLLRPAKIVFPGLYDPLFLCFLQYALQDITFCVLETDYTDLNEVRRFIPYDFHRVVQYKVEAITELSPELWGGGDRILFVLDLAHSLAPGAIRAFFGKNWAERDFNHCLLVNRVWRVPFGPSKDFPPDKTTGTKAFNPGLKEWVRSRCLSFLDKNILPGIDYTVSRRFGYAPAENCQYVGHPLITSVLRLASVDGLKQVFDHRAQALLISGNCKNEPDGADAFFSGGENFEYLCGEMEYNPVSLPPKDASELRSVLNAETAFKNNDLLSAMKTLDELENRRRDGSALFPLAVSLVRAGMLKEAMELVGRDLQNASAHLLSSRLHADLSTRLGIRRAGAKIPKKSRESGSITVFTMPKPFRGYIERIQKNAIRSWAQLKPKPEIFIFGNEHGCREMAEEIGGVFFPDIAVNEFGTPLINEVFRMAEEHAGNKTLCYINADMIFFDDFMQAATIVDEHFGEYLLIGQRRDLPYIHEIDFSDPAWREKVKSMVEEHGFMHFVTGIDYFVYKAGLWPDMPPFAVGRPGWDNWAVRSAVFSKKPVVDCTDFVLAVHQDHDYNHVKGGFKQYSGGIETLRNRIMCSKFDEFGLISGAGYYLDRDGRLNPREPGSKGIEFIEYMRDYVPWLARESDYLLSLGETNLALRKLEEILAFYPKSEEVLQRIESVRSASASRT